MVVKGSKAHMLLPAQTKGVIQNLEALFPQPFLKPIFYFLFAGSDI